MAKTTPKIIARAGQQLQLTCPISGYPIFNINWEKGTNRQNSKIKQKFVKQLGTLDVTKL